MELINNTPFPSMAFNTLDQLGQEFHVVVTRLTLEFDDQGTLTLADEQAPLAVTDEYFGAVNHSSVRQESDLSPYKPRCDVIVNATAHAPQGRPTPEFTTGIRITSADRMQPPPEPYGLNPSQPPSPEALREWHKACEEGQKPIAILDKQLTITGPRNWEKSPSGNWKLGDPAPISTLPIRYEHAYGGQCRIERDAPAAGGIKDKHKLTPGEREQHPDGPQKAPAAHEACTQNPVGNGFSVRWHRKALEENIIPAPQIASPAQPVQVFDAFYPPQGFGVITKAWQPRIALCGTCDATWLKEKHPLPPDDYDFAYWNGAHPDMQIPYPKGDEGITLHNLTPDGYRHLTLPGLSAYFVVNYVDETVSAIKANLDTLVIEPEENRLGLVWRSTLLTQPAVKDIRIQLLDTRDAEAFLSPMQEAAHAQS